MGTSGNIIKLFFPSPLTSGIDKLECLSMASPLTGEGKTTYTFSVSVNAFSIEFPLACYQQAGRVWYISGALRRTYTLFYPAPPVNIASEEMPTRVEHVKVTPF
jgi:hypothetical protein